MWILGITRFVMVSAMWVSWCKGNVETELVPAAMLSGIIALAMADYYQSARIEVLEDR